VLVLRKREPRYVCHAVLLLMLVSTFVFAGTVTVSSMVTPVGDLFHYDYSIANTTPNDLFLIDITVGGSTIDNLSAPAGFKSAYDPGLGLVSFLEDTGLFGPVPQSGFSFDSPNSPGPGSFDATLVDSAGAFSMISGTTTTPTPEPAYLPLIALLVPGFIVAIRRRQRLQRSKVS